MTLASLIFTVYYLDLYFFLEKAQEVPPSSD